MSKYCEWNEEFGTGGVLKCKCDYCGKQHNFKFKKHPDYKEAQTKLKNKGWFARKLDGEWYDFCSDECFEKFRHHE